MSNIERVEMGFEDIRIEKITDRVWYLPDFNELDWPVLCVVVGDRHTLLMDSGASERQVNLLFRELDANNLPRPDICALSHWHWDHTYGLAHLGNIVSVATKDTNRLLRDMQKWEWTDADMQKRIETGEDLAFSYPNINAEYPDKSRIKIDTVTIEYEEKLELDLGGVHVLLKKLPNSHSYDSAVMYIEEEKVIFLGDIVYHDLLPVTPAYYRDLHSKLITGLRKFPFEKRIAGHQPLMSADELYSMLESAEMSEDI